jgi:serine/threonine protein kinase
MRERTGIMTLESIMSVPVRGDGTRLVCPHCGKAVQPRAASGEWLCSSCGRALPAELLAASHSQPSAHPGASGIGQAIREQPTLGPYAIIGELGRGGMGRVYKAMHQTLRQVRALKVLNKNESRDPTVLARFQREARVIAAMNHPNVVKIFEFEHDAAKGYYYFVMEFIDGGSVASILKRQGKLPWPHVLEISLQVARALAEMHQHNLVHRDIKPSNILIDRSGNAKLADLGLARHEDQSDTQLTATGAVMGTIDYIAPEQIVDSRNADIRSDLYALGCTMFNMLTGQVPFPKGSAYQKIQHQMHEPLPEVGPLAPDVPFQLVLILNRLTEKDPNNRYQTPHELIEDLQALARASQPPTDTLHESTIVQLQALAEAAIRDSSPHVTSRAASPAAAPSVLAALPYWALLFAGLTLGLLILFVLWLFWKSLCRSVEITMLDHVLAICATQQNHSLWVRSSSPRAMAARDRAKYAEIAIKGMLRALTKNCIYE